MSNIGETGMAVTLAMTAIFFAGVRGDGGQAKQAETSYRVLDPATQDNLTIFPIVTNAAFDTHSFMTLEEGLRSGQVVVTEQGGSPGLVRPRSPRTPGPMQEHFPQIGPSRGAEVNRLMLINNSDRPLILL